MYSIYFTALDNVKFKFKEKPTNHGAISEGFKCFHKIPGDDWLNAESYNYFLNGVLANGVPHRCMVWSGKINGNADIKETSFRCNMLEYDFDVGITTEEENERFLEIASKTFHIVQETFSSRKPGKGYRYHGYIILKKPIRDFDYLCLVYEQVKKVLADKFKIPLDQAVKAYSTTYASRHRPLCFFPDLLEVTDKLLAYGIEPLKTKKTANMGGFELKKWQKDIINQGVQEGSRNTTLHKLGCSLVYRGEEMETIAELITIANENSSPPLDDRELKSILKSVYKFWGLKK